MSLHTFLPSLTVVLLPVCSVSIVAMVTVTSVTPLGSALMFGCVCVYPVEDVRMVFGGCGVVLILQLVQEEGLQEVISVLGVDQT